MVWFFFLHYTSLCISCDKNLEEFLMLCFVLWTSCYSFLSINIYVCTWIDLLFLNMVLELRLFCNRTWGDRTTLLFWSWSWFCLHHHLVGDALLLITKMLHGGYASLIMEAHHTWRWRHIIMAKEVLALMVWGSWNAGRQFKEEAAKRWRGDFGSSKSSAAIEVGSWEFEEVERDRQFKNGTERK